MQQNSADDVLIMVLCINEDPFQSIRIIHVHLYIENLTLASGLSSQHNLAEFGKQILGTWDKSWRYLSVKNIRLVEFY